mgnify:CR=1 FL=1
MMLSALFFYLFATMCVGVGQGTVKVILGKSLGGGHQVARHTVRVLLAEGQQLAPSRPVELAGLDVLRDLWLRLPCRPRTVHPVVILAVRPVRAAACGMPAVAALPTCTIAVPTSIALAATITVPTSIALAATITVPTSIALAAAAAVTLTAPVAATTAAVTLAAPVAATTAAVTLTVAAPPILPARTSVRAAFVPILPTGAATAA